MTNPPLIRLQKAIADAGVCSRRTAEEWIAEGLVSVNGKKITQMGVKVDPKTDEILVKGKRIYQEKTFLYFAFYKPVNVVVTLSDPEGRPCLADFLKKMEERVYPVGRLDFDSEGLLLLTNDGALTNKLTHPSHQVPKVYEVKVAGHLEEKALQQLRAGIKLEEGMTQPATVVVVKSFPKNMMLKMTITEGKNRQIRRMMESVGHPVIKLRRLSIGPITLKGLIPGQMRPLNKKDLAQLFKEVS